jgi:hypothetical protein
MGLKKVIFPRFLQKKYNSGSFSAPPSPMSKLMFIFVGSRVIHQKKGLPK